MSSQPLDYSPLLPQELGPKLVDATAAWRSANASQDAILFPLFTDVKVLEPDVFAVRNKVNSIGQSPISLCQDISSYAQVFNSVVSFVKDRNALSIPLRALVNRWHHFDPSELTVIQTEVARLLHYDAAEVKSVNVQLKTLSETISSWTSDSSDALFSSSLFDAATHILKPIVDFPSTFDGIALFADAVNLSIQAVNTPLKAVFREPVLGHPVSSPEVVSQALNALVDHIGGYFVRIDKVIADVDALVRNLSEVALHALLISKGIDDFAAGQSSENPVDSTTVVKAWNEAGVVSEGFVSAIVVKSSAATSNILGSTLTMQRVVTIQPAEVETILGPPPTGAKTLFALADLTLRTTGQLSSVLTLPYITNFKGQSEGSDAEVSLLEAMLKTKKSYEDIQSSTVPIMRNIQTYSLLQKTVLPILESDFPVAPSEIFLQWAVLAEARLLSIVSDPIADLILTQSYGASSMKATADCQVLMQKLQTNVGALKSNLDEVKARIAADKEALAAAQREYNALKAQMLIDGILSTILTASTMAAVYAGQEPLAEELGAQAGESLSQVVENDIKAGEIMLLIRKIERIIAITDETRRQLETAITLLADVATSMAEIGDVWTDIKRSLDLAASNYVDWSDSGLLTDELLNALALRWGSFENAAIRYIDSVLGIKTPTTVNLLAIALSGISNKAAKSKTFAALSDTTSPALSRLNEINDDSHLRPLIEPRTVEDRIKKFQFLQASVLDDHFYNAIKAPSVDMSTNRQNLNNSAASYQQAANIMQSLYPSDVDNLRSLASDINNDVIPSVTACVDFYKTFADRQVAALSETPTKATLEDLAAENSKYAEEGLKKAQAAQRKVLDSKNLSVLVHNATIKRSMELQISMDIAKRELRDKKAEHARYDWVKWVPGIGATIKLIVEAIKHTEDQIRGLQKQMSSLQQATDRVNAARGVEEACLSTIASLTQSWVNLTQEANDLSMYLTLITEVPSTAPALAEDAKATWEGLSESLVIMAFALAISLTICRFLDKLHKQGA
ncbi:hypothetical protein ONZ45_g2198 [Pleurotus djamor]|nr:hypothetical protein ONZ45_g2198 [Pleurotus djamor]